MAEVVETLYNHEIDGKVVIDDEPKAAIDAYYEQYGARGVGSYAGLPTRVTVRCCAGRI